MNALTFLAPIPDTAADWAERITHAYRQCVEDFIETGRLLIAAKAALPHGEFTPMIEERLPFGERTAQRLMAIAEHPWLSNPTHASHLPADWTAVYELTKLEPAQLDAAVVSGKIRPDMERKEAINGARAIAHNRVEPADSLNYFPTAPWATRALIDVVLRHLGIYQIDRVWEPACGEGHISAVLQEYVEEAVYATDVFNYGVEDRMPPCWYRTLDFLGDDAEDFDVLSGCEWIITNPPFGDLTVPFIKQALRLARVGVAMLVRSQWAVEGIDRYNEIFRDTPPTLCAYFVERLPIHKGRWEPDGDTFTAYCWLVWVKDMPPQPPFWIPPGQRERMTRPDDAARFTTHPVTPRLAARTGAVIRVTMDHTKIVDRNILRPATPLDRESWERATKATIAAGEKMIMNFWSDQPDRNEKPQPAMTVFPQTETGDCNAPADSAGTSG